MAIGTARVSAGLRAGDSVPDVEAVTLDGRAVRYRDIWQNRLLVLVSVRDVNSPAARRYLEALRKERRHLTAHETEVLVRSAPDETPTVLVADRWGEIRNTWVAEHEDELPPPSELVEWLRFVQMECPECQGETR